MRNIKLVVEYDGTDFLGWQEQAEGRTVQGEITVVLNRILQESVNLIGAGRTDAGVHAKGQVANFRTTSIMDTGAILNALNGLLPDDVVVHSAEDVPANFHARFDARERVYRYYITLRKSAIGRSYRWHVKYHLDLDLMKGAAARIEGVNDFETFSKNGSDIDNYSCDVRRSFWIGEGDEFVYEIRANRFVRGMVRALVGTMVDVGRGFLSLQDFHEIMKMKDRSKSGMAAPACGLILEEILY